ncbi:MAG: Na+/H+ antiporter NhaA [Alphaproteobacteria bacterium]
MAVTEQENPKEKPLLPKVVRQFIATESASGLVMIFFAALALLVANSPFYYEYKSLISSPISFSYMEYTASEPLKNWVKDILMVFFFLIVGLELKREMKEGFLAKKDQILLPLIAAAAGMAVPAAIYMAFNIHHPENHAGWAISSATDIAFALCILMLVGRGVPSSVKIFLLAVAIFDDLGAILIIALFYNSELSFTPLLAAAGGIGALVAMNRNEITVLTPYFLIAIFLWFCFYHSGIHTTVAGVIVGMLIPMRNPYNERHSPVNSVMHFLHPWVSFVVLPVFAFTSAGINFGHMSFEMLLSPLPLGIALSLFLGKQIGIFGAVWLLIKTNIVSKPDGASWMHLYGVSVIAGVGFTMSLFIGILAFSDESLQELVKVGVIGGSALSTVWGYVVLRYLAKSPKEQLSGAAQPGSNIAAA